MISEKKIIAFKKRKEEAKNKLFEKVNATFLERDQIGLFFSFFHPDTKKTEKGFIDYKNVSSLTTEDLETIFIKNSVHKCLLTNWKKEEMYILNYKTLHPEINNSPKKITPTAEHFQNVHKNLKHWIKKWKEKQNND